MYNKKRFGVRQKIMCVLPLLFILVMFILYLGLPDRTFSKEERRYLAQWPVFHFEEVLSGRYGTKVESYFSDQFPFRDFWIRIREGAEQIIFKR